MPNKKVSIEQVQRMMGSIRLGAKDSNSLLKNFIAPDEVGEFEKNFTKNHFVFDREDPTALCMLYMLGKRKPDGTPLYRYEDIISDSALTDEKKVIGSEISKALNSGKPEDINNLTSTYLNGLEFLCNCLSDKLGDIFENGNQTELINKNIRMASALCITGLENVAVSQADAAAAELKDEKNDKKITTLNRDNLDRINLLRGKYSCLVGGVNTYYQTYDKTGAVASIADSGAGDAEFISSVFQSAMAYEYMKRTYRRNYYENGSSVPTTVMPKNTTGEKPENLPALDSLSPIDYAQGHLDAMSTDEMKQDAARDKFNSFKKEIEEETGIGKEYNGFDNDIKHQQDLLCRFGLISMTANGQLFKNLKCEAEYNTADPDAPALKLTNLDFDRVSRKDMLKAAFLSDMHAENKTKEFYASNVYAALKEFSDISGKASVKNQFEKLSEKITTGEYDASNERSKFLLDITTLKVAIENVQFEREDDQEYQSKLKNALAAMNKFSDYVQWRNVLMDNGGRLNADKAPLDGVDAEDTIKDKLSTLKDFDEALKNADANEMSDEWKFLRRTVKNAIKVITEGVKVEKNSLNPEGAEKINSAMQLVQYAATQYVKQKLGQDNFDQGKNYECLVLGKKLESYAIQNRKHVGSKILESIPQKDFPARWTVDAAHSKILQFKNELEAAGSRKHKHLKEFDEMVKAVNELEELQNELLENGQLKLEEDQAYYGITENDGKIADTLKKVDAFIEHHSRDYTMEDYSMERLGIAFRLRTYLGILGENARKDAPERYDRIYKTDFVKPEDEVKNNSFSQAQVGTMKVQPCKIKDYYEMFDNSLEVTNKAGLGDERADEIGELIASALKIDPVRQGKGTCISLFLSGLNDKDGKPLYKLDDIMHDDRMHEERIQKVAELEKLLKNPTKENIEIVDRCILNGTRRVCSVLNKKARDAFEKDGAKDLLDNNIVNISQMLYHLFTNDYEKSVNKETNEMKPGSFYDRMSRINNGEFLKLREEYTDLALGVNSINDKIFEMFRHDGKLMANCVLKPVIIFQNMKKNYEDNPNKNMGEIMPKVPTAEAKNFSEMAIADFVLEIDTDDVVSEASKNFFEEIGLDEENIDIKQGLLTMFGLVNLYSQAEPINNLKVTFRDTREDEGGVEKISFDHVSRKEILHAAFISDMYAGPFDLRSLEAGVLDGRRDVLSIEDFDNAKRYTDIIDECLGEMHTLSDTYGSMLKAKNNVAEKISLLNRNKKDLQNRNAELINEIYSRHQDEMIEDENGNKVKKYKNAEECLNKMKNDISSKDLFSNSRSGLLHSKDNLDLLNIYKYQNEGRAIDITLSKLEVVRNTYQVRINKREYGCYFDPVKEELDTELVIQDRMERIGKINKAMDGNETSGMSPEWKFMRKTLNYAKIKLADISRDNALKPEALEKLDSVMRLLEFSAVKYRDHKFKQDKFDREDEVERMLVTKQLENFAKAERNHELPELKKAFQEKHNFKNLMSKEAINTDMQKMTEYQKELETVSAMTFTHSKEFNKMVTAVNNLIGEQKKLADAKVYSREMDEQYYGKDGVIAKTMEAIRKYIDHKAEQLDTSDYSMERVSLAVKMHAHLRALSRKAQENLPVREEEYVKDNLKVQDAPQA